jgi:hypothetical protein
MVNTDSGWAIAGEVPAALKNWHDECELNLVMPRMTRRETESV